MLVMARVTPHQQRYRFRLVACAALLSLTPGLSHAQSAESKAAARTLGIEGIKQANAGDCAGAIENLTRAEALYHAPTILGRLGECQVQVGRIVEGTENLNRVVREALPEDAPEAFVRARERAQQVLDQALPKIAKLKILVQPVPDKLEVHIGDKNVPLALLGAERPTDPGTHVIVAEAPGYAPAKAEVTLAEGAADSVSLTLVEQPAAVKPPPTVAASTPSDSDAPSDSGSGGNNRTLAYVLWGVGGVGLATGAVTGLLAMGKKGDLEDTCAEPSRCPESSQGTIDSANRFALISNIGFGVGIAGAAAGTVLFFSGDSQESVASIELRGVRATPYVGPTGAGLTGQF